MRASRSFWFVPVAAMLFVAGCGGGDAASQADAAANPCAANPCAADGMIEAALVTQGDNVLDSHGLSDAELVARGSELWNDKSLSANGATACSSCHMDYAMINATFAEPYPHPVAMAKARAGLEEVTAAEMVQLCMVIPMASEPLEWGSLELAALSAHVEDLQGGYPGTAGANPCAANPCAANPCAANPCAANPCAANPCAANPCAANPCAANPCGG